MQASKKQAESDISMSDFRRQQNDARAARDYSPSVGDIKHIDRITNPSSRMPSYEPSELLAKPEYKTRLGRREQEQRATYKLEPASLPAREESRDDQEKAGLKEDSVAKPTQPSDRERKTANRSNQSHRRNKKDESFTMDEPQPKSKLGQAQSRSQSAKRSAHRSDSRAKLRSLPKNQTVETPQQNHRRMSPRSNRSTGRFRGVQMHQKLGIGLGLPLRKDHSQSSKHMPRQRSEISGNTARNNHSIMLNANGGPLSIKASRLNELERKFSQ